LQVFCLQILHGFFKTALEASQAGYRPCKICRPSAAEKEAPDSSMALKPILGDTQATQAKAPSDAALKADEKPKGNSQARQ